MKVTIKSVKKSKDLNRCCNYPLIIFFYVYSTHIIYIFFIFLKEIIFIFALYYWILYIIENIVYVIVYDHYEAINETSGIRGPSVMTHDARKLTLGYKVLIFPTRLIRFLQWTSKRIQRTFFFGINTRKKLNELELTWASFCLSSWPFGHVGLETLNSSTILYIQIPKMTWSW